VFWQSLSESASAGTVPPTLVDVTADRAAREASRPSVAAAAWRRGKHAFPRAASSEPAA